MALLPSTGLLPDDVLWPDEEIALEGAASLAFTATGGTDFSPIEASTDATMGYTAQADLTEYEYELVPSQGSHIYTPGTWGDRTPLGVEAVFKFGGLVLNDLSVTDRYRLTRVDGLLGYPDIDLKELARTEDHGTLDSVLFYGGRNITLAGRIEAHTLSKMRQMIYDLRMAFAEVKRESALYIRSNWTEDRYIMCKKVSALVMSEDQRQQSGYYRDFQVNLRASDPRIISTRVNVASGLFATGAGTNITVANAGNFPAWAKYKIGNAATSVTNPKIVSEGLTAGFYYNGTITGGSNVFTVFDPKRKSMINNANANVLNKNWMPATTDAYFGSCYVWPNFYDGANTMNASCSAKTGSPTVEIIWQNTWI